MYPQIEPERLARRMREAETLSVADRLIRYPRWYSQRWHYLPDGYLSRGSVRLYETLVSPLYHSAMEARALREITARVRKLAPAAVAEIGCGPGHLLSALGEALPSVRVTGFDLSPFMVERARAAAARGAARITAVHADARSLPLPAEGAEVLVASHLIGHLPRDVGREVLAEAARVLAPDGVMLVVDHSWHRTPSPAPLAVRARERLLGGLLTLTTLAHPVAAPPSPA